MLLTSSQVSLAVSSGVVILFTSALFFSGYALQQKTLRDLRRAIHEPPPEPPKIFLPDRFKSTTTELEDGTVVTIVDGNDIKNNNKLAAEDSHDTIVVSASVPGDEDNQKQQSLLNSEESGDRAPQDKSTLPEEQASQARGSLPQKPVSRAERRRRIKEELRESSHEKHPLLYQRRLYD